MFKRRTFHDCASEIRSISDRFKAAYFNRNNWDEARRNSVMVNTSQKGVELLRMLALAVRSEQDYGLTSDDDLSVGVLKTNLSFQEVETIIRDYTPSYNQLTEFSPLSLRQGLNKLAHANPSQSGFYVNDNEHDLILSGTLRNNTWVAVLSLPKLCDVIEDLPDVLLEDS